MTGIWPRLNGIRAAALVFILAAIVQAAHVKPALATRVPEYSDKILAEWQQRYPRGILSNYNEVILPKLDVAERQLLKGVRFEFPLRLEGREPFGFAADAQGRTIYMSIQSLKFLDEASIAAAWLNRNGYSLESLTNYFAMLRHWKNTTAPPALLPTLCIPENALDNRDVDELAQKGFSSAIFFIMLHEIGHVINRDSGYEGVAPALTRAREEKADAYALKIMARVGDPPLGVVNMFLAMAYLFDSRTDFSSDAENQRRIAARPHPLSSQRLRTFADTLEKTAADYRGSGLSRVAIVATAAQISIVARNFSDIQRLTAMIGQAITPADLGPMRQGDKLGRPCSAPVATDLAFSGRFKGTIIIDNVEFDMEAQMTRTGNSITGRSSAGAGVSLMEGFVEGDTLHYRWRRGPDSGRGILKQTGDSYAGNWGSGENNSNGGTIRLRRQ